MQFKLITSSIFLSTSLLLATPEPTTINQVEAKAKAKIASMSAEDFKSYYSKFHKRVSKKIYEHISPISKDKLSKQSDMIQAKKYTELTSVPADMVIPAEFEENQAIVISWPYYTVDKDLNKSYQYFEGLTISYNYFLQSYQLTPITNYPDVFEDSQMAYLYLDLADAIQGEAQVWITVNDLKDTTDILQFAINNEKPLTNYKFIKTPINSIWYRDSGPIAFYYDNLNKIGYIDFEYPGRPLDDAMPESIATITGHALIKSTLEFEGGNTLVNGKNTLFTSNAVEESNSDEYGQIVLTEDKKSFYYIAKDSLTLDNCEDSLRKVMNLKDIHIMPRLINDGGTGHIDLYADFYDENRFVFTQFPEAMNFSEDYTITKKNVDSMLTLISSNNSKYTNAYIPLPRLDNGKWYPNDSVYAVYTRTYSNHLVVNKTIIQPVFHNTFSGDKVGDLAAIEEIKKAYPGYKIVPIDMRILDGSGGSIHCITKQIPANNPIRIFHRPPVASELVEDVAVPYYPINATIESNKAISSVTLFHRIKGTTEWVNMPMDKSDNNYTAHLKVSELPGNTKAIEYYIAATSSEANKTITKPMTAPDGFYTIDGTTASVANNDSSIEMQLYPNPATELLFAKYNLTNAGNYQVRITNELGEQVYSTEITNGISGEQMFSINANILSAGAYSLMIIDSKSNSISSRFVVTK